MPSSGRRLHGKLLSALLISGWSLVGIGGARAVPGDLTWSRRAVVTGTESEPRGVGQTWVPSAAVLTGRLSGVK